MGAISNDYKLNLSLDWILLTNIKPKKLGVLIKVILSYNQYLKKVKHKDLYLFKMIYKIKISIINLLLNSIYSKCIYYAKSVNC